MPDVTECIHLFLMGHYCMSYALLEVNYFVTRREFIMKLTQMLHVFLQNHQIHLGPPGIPNNLLKILS